MPNSTYEERDQNIPIGSDFAATTASQRNINLLGEPTGKRNMPAFPKLYGKCRSYTIVRWAAYLGVFAMIVLMGVHDGSSFIYVSF